jgi:hypothetical protein
VKANRSARLLKRCRKGCYALLERVGIANFRRSFEIFGGGRDFRGTNSPRRAFQAVRQRSEPLPRRGTLDLSDHSGGLPFEQRQNLTRELHVAKRVPLEMRKIKRGFRGLFPLGHAPLIHLMMQEAVNAAMEGRVVKNGAPFAGEQSEPNFGPPGGGGGEGTRTLPSACARIPCGSINS